MKITNQSNLASKITLPDDTEQEVSTDSNISETENMTTSFLKVKSSAKEFAQPKEEVEQTITLTNNSEYDITDISIVDTLSTGATFKEGSVYIDDVSYPDYDIITGFTLPSDITTTSSIEIRYTIVVDETPAVDSITNTAEITYSVNEAVDLVENTNTVQIALVNNVITITKTSNASAVISGQTLTFQNVIKNEGNTKNTNLVFKDPIPEGTTFVSGSVKIDGTTYADYNPETGFSLPDLDPQDTITILFDVLIS
ncbi:MAG: DUF11 domain-containing protein [Clostridiales bacterium]|nr:DUF11 domain-containing protein [Candidatus Apopatousia equi]